MDKENKIKLPEGTKIDIENMTITLPNNAGLPKGFTLDKLLIGLKGESMIRKMLIDMGYKIGQLDLVVEKDGEYSIIEIKTQERFLAPPADGHGLPPIQVKFRMALYEKYGIMPVLIVVDENENEILAQEMPKLEQMPDKFKTKTGKRVIYPIGGFEDFNEYFKCDHVNGNGNGKGDESQQLIYVDVGKGHHMYLPADEYNQLMKEINS